MLVLALAVLVGFLIGPSIFFSVCAGAFLWVVASDRAERTLAIALPVAFRVALALGAFHFEPPIQIFDLAVRNVPPVGLIQQQDLWWPRYLVAYPAIAAMDQWGMRFADAFALYTTALLPLTASALLAAVRTWRRLSERSALAVGLALAVAVALLATQMNGRLVPAHMGMAAVLLAQARIVVRRHLGLPEGLLLGAAIMLGHMTSGTGLVAYAVLVAGSILIVLLRIEPERILAVLWVLSVVFGPVLFRDLLKNVDFYGGGAGAILTMLDHGPGTFFRRDLRLAAVALAVAASVVVVLWRLRHRILAAPRALWPALLALPVTSIGGLYGYSALTMAIPAAMILAAAGGLAATSPRRA